MGFLRKLQITLPYHLATPLLGIYPDKTIIQKDTCTAVLIAALFTITMTCMETTSVQVNSLAQSCPTLCDPMNHSRQASLSITNSWSLLKLMSIESVTPSNHLILCRPLLLLPSVFPSIRVFSTESVFHIRWKQPTCPSTGEWMKKI